MTCTTNDDDDEKHHASEDTSDINQNQELVLEIIQLKFEIAQCRSHENKLIAEKAMKTIEKLKKEIDVMNQRNEEQDTIIFALKEQLDEQAKETTKMVPTKKNDQFKVQCEPLKSENDESERENQIDEKDSVEVAKETERLKEELDVMGQKTEEQDTIISALRGQLDEQAKETTRVVNDLKMDWYKYSQLQSDNLRLKKEKERIKALCGTLKSENDELKVKLDLLNSTASKSYRLMRDSVRSPETDNDQKTAFFHFSWNFSGKKDLNQTNPVVA